MKRVERSEILDFVTYSEQRDTIRSSAMVAKEARRIRVGDALTFLFENTETVRYQVLEMVRAEKIVREADVQHELDTYNELLGEPGELGCTLLIGIDDPEKRDRLLREWLTLPQHIFVELEGGARVPARFDERQVGKDRVSSVQFLKFNTDGKVPSAIVVDHPKLQVKALLNDAQKSALGQDL